MKVFVSYAHDNMSYAKKIEKDLKNQGIDVLIDDGIKNSTIWLQQIDKGMVEADFVLGIVTNSYLESTGAKEGFSVISKHIKDEVGRNSKKWRHH